MESNQDILFATDLTENSLQVLEYAIDYAEKSNSNLILLHVVEFTSILTNKFEKLTSNHLDNTHGLDGAAIELLNKIKKRIINCHKINVKYQILHGNLINTTMKYIYKTKPDILMLAATNSNTAFKFADCSPIPTLTINLNTKFNSIKTILFPISDKFYTTYKIEEIIRICKIYDAKVVILGISPNNSDSIDIVNLYIKRVLTKLDEKSIPAKSNVVISENYTEAISKFSDENDIDLISIVSNYETGFLSFFHKSPDEILVKSSTIPVLSIPIIMDLNKNDDLHSEYISPWSMNYDINNVSLGF